MGRILSVCLGGATIALVAAACGSSSSQPSSATVATSPPTTSAHLAVPPAASGTVAALAASSMQVQNSTSGEVTVDWSASTRFVVTTTEAPSAMAIGSCISVVSVGGVARSISVVAAPGATCAAPKRLLRRPRRHSAAARGNFAFLVGTLSAVSAGSLSVNEVAPKTASATVALGATTRVISTAVGSASSLALGDCVLVRGSTNSIGTVAATSVAVSPSVNGNCAAGRRGFGGGFGGAARAGSGAVGA